MSLWFDVVVYDDDGPGGGPGTPLGSVASSTSTLPPEGAIYEVDIRSEAITITSGSVFVGVLWDPGFYEDVTTCADESLSTPEADGWFAAEYSFWSSLRDTIPEYRALLVTVRGGT
jgi:hypothetical protein